MAFFLLGFFMTFRQIIINSSVTACCLIGVAEASVGLGYTGGLVTPNADVQDFGSVAIGASNFLSPYYIENRRLGTPKGPREAENYFIGIGVLPGLEIFGGLSEVHRVGADPNAYLDLDQRDLVGNVKWQFYKTGNSRFALGINDAAGLVVKERRYYGVASHDFNFFDLSLGYSELPDETENQQMFSGVFTNIEVPLPYGFSFYAEHDGHTFRQGLGGGWALSESGVQLDAKAIINSDFKGETSSAYIGIQIPLIRPSGTKLYENTESKTSASNINNVNSQASLKDYVSEKAKNELPSIENISSLQNVTHKCEAAPSLNKREIEDLTDILFQQGLGNVMIACSNDKLTVAFNNRLFISGEPEAFIAASQILRDHLKRHSFNGRISMHVYSAKSWDIAAELEMSHTDLRLLDVSYVAKSLSNDQSILTGSNDINLLDISIYPIYRANFGSEVGVADSSIGARFDLQTQPWRNAWLNYKYDYPLYNSYHYQDGGFFEDRAIVQGMHELSLSQRWFINDISSIELIGGVRDISGNDYTFQGGTGTMHDRSGAHSIYAKAVSYQPVDDDLVDKEVISGGYRWLSPSNKLALSYEGGSYFFGDFSDKLKAMFYLDKYSFEVSYTGSSEWAKVGAVLSMPFGPKKKYQIKGISFGGQPSWSPSLYTVVKNPVTPHVNVTNGSSGYVDIGLTPSAGVSGPRTEDFDGRWSPVYLKTLFNRMMDY